MTKSRDAFALSPFSPSLRPFFSPLGQFLATASSHFASITSPRARARDGYLNKIITRPLYEQNNYKTIVSVRVASTSARRMGESELFSVIREDCETT